MGDATAPTAESKGWAKDRRQSDGVEGCQSCLNRGNGRRRQHRQPGLLHGDTEFLAVLGEPDRSHLGTEKSHSEPLEVTRLLELDCEVEGGLAAEGRDQGVRPFLLEDCDDGLFGQRLDIGAVGETGVGHHGRRVRVDEDDPTALLAQGTHSLDPGVIELAGLTDSDWTGAEDAHGGGLRVHWATALLEFGILNFEF